MLMLKKQQSGLKLSLAGLIIRWVFVIFNVYMLFVFFNVAMTDICLDDVSVTSELTSQAAGLTKGMALLFVSGIWLIGLAAGLLMIKITKPVPLSKS
ncbi:hypothetical protein [Escherichia coli]|uniref:hypothetical protein n=1 Tax=Escherichia coli TaxID=562 RepID=UPI00287A0612|nr:hypothetical protein [Escherichia coli]MDS1618979.1 hypothetical protein [Escherichia coli]